MFVPMLIGAAAGGTASFMSLLHHYRQQLGPMSVREARLIAQLPTTPIGLAKNGLVKLVGTVGGDTSVTSYYDRVPCAVLELLHYEVVDSARGSRRMLVKRERHVQPFWIEDETGRVPIDPAHARLDYEVEGTDLESTIEEHRLRLGERVVLLGMVRRGGPQLSQPMRTASTNRADPLAFEGPPLVTWRSEPEVYPRLLPPTGGVALSLGSVGMAVLGALLNL